MHEISVRFIFITICVSCTTDKKGFVLYSVDSDGSQGMFPSMWSFLPPPEAQIGILSLIYMGKKVGLGNILGSEGVMLGETHLLYK